MNTHPPMTVPAVRKPGFRDLEMTLAAVIVAAGGQVRIPVLTLDRVRVGDPPRFRTWRDEAAGEFVIEVAER